MLLSLYSCTGTQLKLKMHTKNAPSTLIFRLTTKLKFKFSEDLSAPILALELSFSPSLTSHRNATAHLSLYLVDFGTQSYIYLCLIFCLRCWMGKATKTHYT